MSTNNGSELGHRPRLRLSHCICVVMLVLSALAWGLTCGSQPALANSRHAAMVIDANTGEVLHAEKADEPRHPASLTKMMTLYLAFEAIERGRAGYSTRIKVSEIAAEAPPTKLDLDPGDTIALIDAIKSLITKSANDMAVAIAEHLAGSETQFARLMNDKARALGMTRTVFRNASGLPDTAQVTTARDMLTLAIRLYDDFPRHYPLFSLRSFTYQGTTYKNHNALLSRFVGTDGIKTGYTRMSGFNLVSSVRRGGRHVMGVVMGGTTADRRDDAMRLLLSRALVKASPVRRRVPRPVLVAERRAPDRIEVAPAPAPPSRPAAPHIASSRAPVAAPVAAPAPLAAGPVPPVPRLAQRPERALPPSTLARQAENLARGASAPSETTPAVRTATPRTAHASGPPHGLRGPDASPAPAATPGGFEIQVGAYGSMAEAERVLAATRERAGDLLGTYRTRALPVQKDNRQIYRARYWGFDATTAASTCLELRRRQVDCFVARAD